MIALGSKVKDKISGFTGIVRGRCEYLGGMPRILITSQSLYEGKVREDWFDEANFEMLEGPA